MQNQQRHMKIRIHEKSLRQKPPINRPLEFKDSPKVESPSDIGIGIGEQKRCSEQQLNPPADRQVHNSLDESEIAEVRDEQSRRKEQNIHLYGDSETVENATEVPSLIEEGVDGRKEKYHRYRVVEQSENEDGMDSVRRAENQYQNVKQKRTQRNYLKNEANPPHKTKMHLKVPQDLNLEKKGK